MIDDYLRAPLRAASLCLALGACASGGDRLLQAGVGVEVETYLNAFEDAEAAGLALYDALAPAFPASGPPEPYLASLGPARLAAGGCEARYAADALRARCAALSAVAAFNAAAFGARKSSMAAFDRQMAALSAVSPTVGGAIGSFRVSASKATRILSRLSASDDLAAGAEPVRGVVAALRADAGALYALGRAAQAAHLGQAEEIWLEAMDRAFEAASGKAPPVGLASRAAFERAIRRLVPVLSRQEPRYGVAALFDVMAPNGAPLGASQVAVIEAAIGDAEVALAEFDRIAVGWRGVADAVATYEAMLSEIEAHLSGDAEAGIETIFAIRANASAILNRIRLIGGEI